MECIFVSMSGGHHFNILYFYMKEYLRSLSDFDKTDIPLFNLLLSEMENG